MKNILLGLLIICFSGLNGQDCSEFYPMLQGTVSELTAYDKKGKVSSIAEYTISDSGANKATLNMKLTDKKGELINESSFDITCTGDGVLIDAKSMFSPQLMSQYENVETTITGSDVALPNNMKVGDKLKDADMFVSIDMGGIKMNIDVMMLDRKVVDEETISTPAGTFDCIVIEYQSKIKMGLERNGSAKQWYSKGVGIVQQEDYNKKGKLTGSSVLTAFKK